MKINREELLKGLKMAAKVVESKSSLPILATVLIDGPGQKIQTTDLEMVLTYPIKIEDWEKEIAVKPDGDLPDADMVEGLKKDQLIALNDDYDIVPKEDFNGMKVLEMKQAIMDKLKEKAEGSTKQVQEQYCLDAKRLLKVIESLSDTEVELNFSRETGMFGMTLVSVGSLFQDLPSFSAEEYPVFTKPEMDEEYQPTVTKVSRDNLRDVLLSMPSAQEGGFKINVVYFDGKYAVTTDGHRLHRVEASVEGDSWTLNGSAAKALLDIAKTDKEMKELVLTRQSDSFVSAEINGAEVHVRVDKDAKFPDYKVITDEKEGHSITVKKSDVMSVMKRANILAGESYTGAKFEFNGSVDVSFINPEVGTYSHQGAIPCKGKVDPTIEVGMNVKYVMDVFKTVADDETPVKIGLVDNAHRISFSHGEFFGVVMPIG